MNQFIKFDNETLSYLKNENHKTSVFRCSDCERPIIGNENHGYNIEQIDLAKLGYKICFECAERILFK